MKQRITFVHTAPGGLSLEQIESDLDSLQVKSLRAVREERLTFGLDELPREVRYNFLTAFHDGKGELNRLNRSTNKSISTPTATSPFTTSSALQCYEILPSLADIAFYVKQIVCSTADPLCRKRLERLQRAGYVDIDYDGISHNLVLTFFNHKPTDSEHWNDIINIYQKSAKAEVGILAPEKATEQVELSLGGVLVDLSEDQGPKPTRFSFPSRHHIVLPASDSTFLTTFPPPTGLHPILRLTFPSGPSAPPNLTCTLHAYLVLPSPLFIDKYQLSSPNFLAAKNLRTVRALSGDTDLEAPHWVTRKWGSALLMELAPPTVQRKSSQVGDALWYAEIPLHLRYLVPANGGITNLNVPWPVVFWACPAEEGVKMHVNPFDRVSLGYESLFGPRTMFYHLQPQPALADETLVAKMRVPVMDVERTTWVEIGTVAVVVLGVLWVSGMLSRVLLQNWKVTGGEVSKKTQ
ncbi:MAG: hypothetical protein Q9219_001740 [cf. Caloplaca sp. 3 TL-2023]